MPLVDTGKIVRYYIDEAASGQGPSAVLDGSGVGADFDLTLTYDGTDLNYTEISGNRGLLNIDDATLARAEKAINDSSDKVRDNIHGSKTATVEVVVRVDGFRSAHGRCFVINKGSSNPAMGLSGTSGTNARVYFNATLMRSFNPGSARAHIVIAYNTAETTADDRIKIYIDDVLQSPTINANPALDATFDIEAGSKMFMFNRGDSGYQRSMEGVLFYAALYSIAFSSSQVTTNYNVLIAGDDTPGGQIYNEEIALAGIAAQAQGGVLTLQEVLALAASGALAQSSIASLGAPLSLDASAAQAQGGGLTLQEAVTLTASAAQAQIVGLILEAVLSLDASGAMQEGNTSDVLASAGLSASAQISNQSVASLIAALALSASGAMTPTASAVMTTLLSLGATADIQTEGTVTVGVYDVFLTLDASAGLTTGGQLVLQVARILSAGADITPAAGNEIEAVLGLSSSASLTPSNVKTLGAELALGVRADIAAAAQQVMNALLALGATAAQAQAANKVVTDTLTLAVSAVMAQALVSGIPLPDIIVATLQALVPLRSVEAIGVERSVEALEPRRTVEGA